MARARRKKRASATDLYRTCKQAGTCPPDVINKVEGKTVADKILQYGSAGVFFGGLGISTGRGAGTATGYVPLGETPGVTVGARPTIRPNIPLETIGPEDIFPVDAVRPTDPSVVDLSGPASAPSDPGIGGHEIEVIAEVHPVPPRGPINTPTTSSEGGSAILEVAPEPSPPVRARYRVSKSQHFNPEFHGLSTSTSSLGEVSGSESILVVSGSGGQTIGESIELATIPSTVSADTGIVEETTFGGRTSTPEVVRGRRPWRGPSRRYFTYTEVPLDTVNDPRRAVGADIINPAFDIYNPDISLEFAEQIGHAPNKDFTGVTRLSRPYYGEGGGGRFRIGRLGQKASMKTRSGITIGPRDFFYKDISSIAAPETIELSDLSEQIPVSEDILPADSGHIVDSDAADLDSVSLGSVSVYSDNQLLDDTSFEFVGQLSFGPSRRAGTNVELPTQAPKFYEDYDIVVDYGGEGGDSEDITPDISPSPPQPTYPAYEGQSSGSTYYLHPSLHRIKKRKRSKGLHVRFSVPDGILAS